LNQSEEYWLALARAPSLRPTHFIYLINRFGGPRGVFEAGRWEWRALSLKRDLLKYLQNPNWHAVENDMHWLTQPGNHLLTLDHPDYPVLLREIHQPPPLLFVQGDCALLKTKQLAIVGTRYSSREGERTAREFAECLSHLGFTITSGMAYGIDGASHWGALAGTGKTIAVAGRGLDQIYPTKHHELAHRIMQTGAIISEFPPGTPVKREHFSRRSRIISGLSLGTLVIEAPRYSTALHTVYFALEQGREVFAIPGSIHSPLVKGSHKLIKEGAKLVETPEDILEELQIYIF
jgi:DNA processing protein